MEEVSSSERDVKQTTLLSDQSDNDEEAVKVSEHHAMASYLDQWRVYFEEGDNLFAELKSRAFKESLRSCHFRSICWRVFLGCLSEEVNSWFDQVATSRQRYDVIKSRNLTNPHSSEGQDIDLENPLSQSDSSSWSQYFKNNELKTMIDRDVKRTCPEMDFFHSERIRDLMANVLFCYAREHESLSYRQGMHELLGPLVFVLHCDLQGAAHAMDIGELPKIICNLLDERFLEHDVYAMFCQVMNATNAWYSVNCCSDNMPQEGDREKSVQTVPFQPVGNNINGPPLAITNKLNHIHDILLATFDVELYHHLNRLEIIPQVYGLRWVRLLFGREFDLQDLLVLWDALFADSKSLELVDYIFIAMMYNIRQQLLSADYCNCMQLLMKYPPIEDIYDLVHLAMYYRDPKNNKRPSQHRFKLATTQTQPKIQTTNTKKKILPNFKIDNPFTNIGKSFKKVLSSPTRTRKNSSNMFASDDDSQTQRRSSGSDTVERTHSKFNRLRSMSSLESIKSQKETETLKQQLDELEEKCKYCSDKLDASIRLLQHHLVVKSNSEGQSEDVANGDGEPTQLQNEEPLVALANIKQVRDILRGSVSFAESSDIGQRLERLPSPPNDIPLADLIQESSKEPFIIVKSDTAK